MNQGFIHMHSLLQELVSSFFEVLSTIAEPWPALEVQLSSLEGVVFCPPLPPGEPGCGVRVHPFCSSAKTPSLEARTLRRWLVLRPVLCSYRFLGHSSESSSMELTISLSVLCLSAFLENRTSLRTILPTPRPLYHLFPHELLFPLSAASTRDLIIPSVTLAGHHP